MQQNLALSMRRAVASPARSVLARHAPNQSLSVLDRRVSNVVPCRSFQGTPPVREKFKKGWLYEFRMIFSKEAKIEREQKLKAEITQGRFWELRELDDTGGKLFEADVGLLPAEKSMPFPNVDGFLLNGEKANTSELLGGKVSLVTVCIRDMGRPMTDSWATSFRKEIGDNAGAQVVQLSFVEGSMYKVGYAFLVDPERRIRWRAVGYALKHEINLLAEAISALSPASAARPPPPRKRSNPKAKKA